MEAAAQTMWFKVGTFLFVIAFLASVIFMRVLIDRQQSAAREVARAESYAEKGTARKLEPLWSAPEFAYVDQRGGAVTRQTLVGQVWVANFIFTQCRTICPLLSAKMVQLQKQLLGVDARFVSFSVDPAHDTPEVLAAYAKKWNPEESRWTLLSTNDETLGRTASGFHVIATKQADGGIDPIMHSGVFVLVDREGMVRGVYDSEHREDFKSLARDVVKLAGEARTPRPVVERTGEFLYHELSCTGCHENEALAPALTDLRDARRELDTGAVITIDDAYLRESILNPEAKRVRGYPLKMPTYDGLVSEADLEQLSTYLFSRRGAAKADEARVVEDPVCQMQVRVTDDTPRAEHDGGTFFFCSQMCRDRFAKTPQAFSVAR